MTDVNRNIPKRRFKEFENADDWEERKLGEIVDFSVKTNSLSRDKLSDTFYEVQNIHYGDILTKFDDILDLRYFTLPSILDGKISDYLGSLLKDGDIIFADAAEDSTVGKAVEINHLNDKMVVSGLHTIVARPTISFAQYYLGYYINSSFYHNQILPLMQGTKVSSINKLNLQSTNIAYPKIFPEQKKIGTFFSDLDRLITLHQRKLDKLKNVKKAYLSELFPAEGEHEPKRRFSGFTAPWEQRKLGEVADIFDGTHQTPKYTNSGVMFLSVENINTLKSEKYICQEDFEKEFKIFPTFNDILMTRIGDIGTSNIVKTNDKIAYYVSLALIKPKNLESHFLNSVIQSKGFQNELWKRTLHIAFPKKINKGEISEVYLKFPSFLEQKKIGTFFSTLDRQIALHQRKLDKLKDMKKAYLNELFV